MKATENKAKDVETKVIRKDLAAELGELTLARSKLVAQINRIDARCNQLGVQLESMK